MKKPIKKKIFYYAAVIGLLVFFHYTKILSPLENIVISLLNPITSSIYSASSGIRETYNNQTNKIDLIKNINKLREDVEYLTVENANLKKLEEENEKLRYHLKFAAQTGHNYILANVVSKGVFLNENEAEQSIIIDKGMRDNIVKDLAVVNSRGILVGRVTEVKDNISKICLILDSNCRMAATIQNSTKTAGVTEGELGLTVKMGFIPQTEQIANGDIVVTSGLEKNIPRGLVIGKITNIKKDNNNVWQEATVESLVNLDNLIIVSVLLPNIEK